MSKNLKKDEKGFTIIEVLIVLAIAGLIMLIVFLAVPALQRNSRNTQRSNDASRVSGAISECLSNNNGNLNVCNNATAVQLNRYVDMAANQQLTNFVATAPVPNNLDTAYYRAGFRCVDNVAQAGGGARSFVIEYNVETTGNPAPRCIGS